MSHFSLKKKFLFLCSISLLLFQTSYNFQIKELKYEVFQEGFEESDVQEGIIYKVTYIKGQVLQNYIRVKATHFDDETNNVYMYFSPINENRNQAVLLNSVFQDEVSLYINKAFLISEADGTFYVTVACYSSSCSYELSVLELDEIDLARDDSYSYYVTDKRNTENTFKVVRADSYSEEAYLTFWASGDRSDNVQMSAKFVDEDQGKETEIPISTFPNGKFCFIKEADYPVEYYKDSTTVYFIITVSSNPNVLINVGSKVTLIPTDTEKIRPKTIVPNGREIKGVLNQVSSSDCFDFGLKADEDQKYYLNIIDYKKSIDIVLRTKEGTKGSSFSIPDGMTTMEITSEYSNYFICLEKNNQDASLDATYSFQLTDKESQGNYQNIYAPQINGYSYVRYLKPGQQAFYTGLPVLDFKTEYRYNLKVISGYPKMYFVKCITYPNCNFDISSLPSDTKIPHEINGLYSYSIFKTEMTSAISGEQYVLLAYCQGNDVCKFETNFFNEKDIVTLRQDQKIFYTIMTEGKSTFLINLNNENEYKQIFVDFLTFSGDIAISYLAEGFAVRNYVAGNKKYFVIDKNAGETQSSSIYFYVSGNMATHYAIDYKLIHSDDDKKMMRGETGVSYLETIEPKVGYKTIVLQNKKVLEQKNFLVDFVSLNCQISVKRKVLDKETPLENIDYMTQDVFIRTEETASEYDVGEYSYFMEISKMDNVTEYDQNWCMIYVSSIEQNDLEDNYKTKQLTVSEGVVNQVILSENFDKIQYIYPHINPDGYVVINFNLETQSKLAVKIFIENQKYKELTIAKSQYYIIEENDLRQDIYCPKLDTRPNQACNIILEFALDENFYQDEPVVEFIIKSKEIIPAFIRKSMLRQDVIVGNFYQYYFTEVGKNEEGNIIINFNRGGGHIFGRIVSKDENEGKGWMGRFILPDESNNELRYDHYTKKIIYNTAETEKCQIGCYLLLKVAHNMTGSYFNQENIAYPISISVHADDGTVPIITPDILTIVDIPINEFIIGDISPSSIEYLLDYYTFWIPYDCEELLFEFLTDSCILYINVGDTKPTKFEHDFNFTLLGYNSAYKLTKSDIIKKINDKNDDDSLKNKQLTIGVGAKYFDDVNSSIYSFRIRARGITDINLIELTSEQNTLCNIKGKTGNCYFLLPHHRKIDELNNFFFYALPEPNVEFNYYADEVDKEIIIERNEEEIKKIIPDENSKWVSHNFKGNYLYIPYNEIINKDNGVYLLLNIEVKAELKEDDEKTTVNLLHTLYSYNDFYLPNPSSYQLFSVKQNPIKFNFILENQNAMIHIVTVSGKGKIYWDDSELSKTNDDSDVQTMYYLNNPGDSVDLTLGTSDIFPLYVSNVESTSNEEPGFGFYMYYQLISKRDNYNEIKYGTSQEIDFKDSNFPFIFYTRLPDKDHEVDVMIKLNNLIKSSNTNQNNNKNTILNEESEDIKNDEFEIIGIVTDENIIYSKKAEPDIVPSDKNKFKGTFYSENKLARIQFTPSRIKNFNIQGDNYLYIILNKTETNLQEYQGVSMECSVLPTNKQGYYSPINMYNQAKIAKDYQGYILYELDRVSLANKYMRIEFASNTDKINFAIISNYNQEIKDINYYQNDTSFIQDEVYGGKSVVIIEFKDNVKSAYLSIFNKENSKHINNEDKLSNFVYRYQVSENNDFSKLKPDDETLKYEYVSGDIKITIPAIKEMKTPTYVNIYAKLMTENGLVFNEKIDTVAQIESKALKMIKKSVTAYNDEQTFEIVDINNNTKYYVVVYAEVFEEQVPEVFVYKSIVNPTKYDDKDNNSSYKWVILILIIIVVIVALILIFVCLVLRKTIRRKTIQLNDLNEQFSKGKNVLEE